jgi:hypothetical protein
VVPSEGAGAGFGLGLGVVVFGVVFVVVVVAGGGGGGGGVVVVGSVVVVVVDVGLDALVTLPLAAEAPPPQAATRTALPASVAPRISLLTRITAPIARPTPLLRTG